MQDTQNNESSNVDDVKKRLVSLNGIDGVGKTTIAKEYVAQNPNTRLFGPISHYGFLPNYEPQQMRDWWFDNNNTDAVNNAVIDSLVKRQSEIEDVKNGVVLVDRSNLQYVITLATRVSFISKTGSLENDAKTYENAYFEFMQKFTSRGLPIKDSMMVYFRASSRPDINIMLSRMRRDARSSSGTYTLAQEKAYNEYSKLYAAKLHPVMINICPCVIDTSLPVATSVDSLKRYVLGKTKIKDC